MGPIRDRIIGLRRVKAGDLIANDRNWRKHPKAQREALEGILQEVGYAGALLAYETAEGLKLIDGHLRASTGSPKAVVPVLVLDVTEDEADKLLASIDPIAAMADTDGRALANLLGQLTTDSDGLAAMLADLQQTADQLARATYAPITNPESGAAVVTQGQIDVETGKLQGRFTDAGAQSMREVCCPNCGIEFGLDLDDA